MKRIALFFTLFLAASCGGGGDAAETEPASAAETETSAQQAADPAPAQHAAAGPPPVPLYQMRAEAPAGDRHAAGRDGKALFEARCGACHLAGGMGTNLLTKQRMALGEPPGNGLLTHRDDLAAPYVEIVVRNGKMAMPPLSRVDVTDAELAAIAAYLAGDNE